MDARTHPRLVICVPSLARLQAFEARLEYWTHVVFDELGMSREMTANPILSSTRTRYYVDTLFGRVAEKALHNIMLQFAVPNAEVRDRFAPSARRAALFPWAA